MESSYMWTVTSMRGTGLMTRQMAWAYTFIITGQDTKASGKMICNMVKGRRHGLMARYMKDTTQLVRSMVSECTAGMTARGTRVNGSKIRLEGSVHILG